MSFTNISNTTRCDNIVNADQLDKDIANNEVPQFVYYTPDVSIILLPFAVKVTLLIIHLPYGFILDQQRWSW